MGDLNLPVIFVMVIASVVGLAYLRYGKKQAEVRFIFAGVALMMYGYFVDSLLWSIVVGVIIGVVPFVWR